MREIPHTRFAGHREKLNVNFYTSGKLLVQGKGTREFVEFVLEPEILQEARLGYEAEIDPDFVRPRLGVDESGKGDFFGPLVIAGGFQLLCDAPGNGTVVGDTCDEDLLTA